MTDKELRKLRRSELMELLLLQSQTVDELREKLNDAQKQADSRRLLVENSGSIAEASLRINQVFEDAQSAANLYLENLRDNSEKCDELEDQCREKCLAMEAQSQAKCEAMEQETRQRCAELEAESHTRCTELENETRRRCEALEEQFRQETEESRKFCAELEEKIKTEDEESRKRREHLEEEVRQRCEAMLEEAKARGAEYTETVRRKLLNFAAASPLRRVLLLKCVREITTEKTDGRK